MGLPRISRLAIIGGLGLLLIGAAAAWRLCRTHDQGTPARTDLPVQQDSALGRGSASSKEADMLLTRVLLPAAETIAQYPPQLTDSNKRVVYRVACPEGVSCGGTMVFTRWAEMRLPTVFPDGALDIQARADVFGYEPTPDGALSTEWYLNFADEDLFFGYGGPLFAQDEMQVAEHPALGALREALLRQGVTLLTAENGRPTPVLVMGVERRCAISTDVNPAEGRPQGLYGQRFAKASEDAVKRATKPLKPPTLTNVIALCALRNGQGPYRREEIEYTLATAYTGFRAARLETLRAWKERAGADAKAPATVIHTGFWGCGAFGGDRELMAIVQLLAARLAGVDRLVFHTFNADGMASFHSARSFVEKELPDHAKDLSVDGVIATIESRQFRWNFSDGN